MKITQEEVVDRQTVLQIELEDEDLDKYLDRGYRRVAQRTIIPGFRKGRAPRVIVERYLGRESLLNEVLDSMLPEVTDLAIKEQRLDPAGLPRIELLAMSPFSLKATVPLPPLVHLGPYRDIRLPAEPVAVTEEQVRRRLEELRQPAASWEPADRPVRMGDMVTVRAVGKAEGRTVLSEQDSVLVLDEDSDQRLPGFCQCLVGMVKDLPKEFDLAIPSAHPDPAIAGREGHFTATISEVKEGVLPDLDDEFAKGVGDGYESLDALRQGVEKELRAEAESEAARRHRGSVVKALLELSTVELPLLMVEHEASHIEGDRIKALSRFNVRLDDYLSSLGKTEDEMRSELWDQAIERLKLSSALSKVAEIEGLEVADGELEERVQSLLGGPGEEAQRVEDSVELRGAVRGTLLLEKTVDRLVAIATGAAPALATPGTKPAEKALDPEVQSPEKEVA